MFIMLMVMMMMVMIRKARDFLPLFFLETRLSHIVALSDSLCLESLRSVEREAGWATGGRGQKPFLRQIDVGEKANLGRDVFSQV